MVFYQSNILLIYVQLITLATGLMNSNVSAITEVC